MTDNPAHFTAAAMRDLGRQDRIDIAAEIDRQLEEEIGPSAWLTLIALVRLDVVAAANHETATLSRLHPDFGRGGWGDEPNPAA